MISLIVATSQNNVIGNSGKLPWKISNDLKIFKEHTLNNIIVMGKNTFLSIPKLLPNRETWLISQEKLIEKTFCSIGDTICHYKMLQAAGDQRELIFIGGSRIYEEALKYVEKIYLTKVHAIVPGDTFFHFKLNDEWKLLNEVNYWKDEKNEYDHSFIIYEKNKY